MMIYKHVLWNLTTKITFFFYWIYLLNVLFFNVLSYFAKPRFIVYDEWFDNDLKKITPDYKNKKIKIISNIHEFFYEQSTCKVGASENNLQIDIDINKGELFNNYYFENNLEKYASLSDKKFLLFEKLTRKKLKINIANKLTYSLSIFIFVFILGSIMFSISQSKNNESNLTNRLIYSALREPK